MRRIVLLASCSALSLAAWSPATAAGAAKSPLQVVVGGSARPAARPSSTPPNAVAPRAGAPTATTGSNPLARGPLPQGTTSPTNPSPAASGLTGLARSVETPAAEFEPVQLTTQDDLRLGASFFPPRGRREARSPGAILVHDAGRSRADLVGLATTLQRRGFAVLTLDLRGHGDSQTNELRFDPEDREGAERLWAFTLRDLEAAARYLRSRAEVHASNLSLVGVGAGAALAARHASRDGNARAIVLIAPRTENLGFDLYADVKGLGGLPTLILAERDRRPEAERLAQAGNAAENLQYIDVTVLRTNGISVLEDSRLPREVTRHLHDNVTAQR